MKKFLTVSLVSLLALSACKESRQKATLRAELAVQDSDLVDQNDTISKEKDLLRRSIVTYLKMTKDEDLNDAELRQNLIQLSRLVDKDNKAVESFVEAGVFSHLDSRLKKVQGEESFYLADTNEDSDKVKVEGLVKGAAIYTVVLASLATVGTTYIELFKSDRLTMKQSVNITIKGGLSLYSAIYAGMILSNDEIDKDVVLAMSAVSGLGAAWSIVDGFSMVTDKKTARTEAVKYMIKDRLIKEGRAPAEAEKIYSEAYLKKPTEIELAKLRTDFETNKDMMPVIDRATYVLHDTEVKAKVNSEINTRGATAIAFAVPSLVMGIMTIKDIYLTESPKEKMMREVQEFFEKMKAIELARTI